MERKDINGRKKGHDFTNDAVFQSVFGKVGNERITKKMLEDILGIQIDGLTLDTNKRLIGEYIDEKVGRIDVSAKLDDGTKIAIEMQVVPYDYMVKRILYYWARKYTEGLGKGKHYTDLTKTIVILFYVDRLKNTENIKKCHTEWRLRETEHKDIELTEDIEIHIIELSKYDKSQKGIKGANWIQLIKDGGISGMKSEEELEKELIEAIEELEKIKDDPVMQGILEQREIDLRDKLSIGAENREKGIKEGEAKMIKAMYQNGIEIDMIVKISGLDKGEVEKIIKEK